MKNSVLVARNQERWDKATFKASALKQAAPVAKRLVKAKDIYVNISSRTGVPWFVVAVIHEREASQRWDRSIAQGDPWNKKSIHVPKGRGPFTSFEDAAEDSLINCAPYASKWSDWSAGGTLTLLELYNGLGYSNKGLPSPYTWSGSNQYVSGKYVADHVYDPNVVDPQLGCAVLLDAMHSLDESVSFDKIKKSFPKLPKPTKEEEIALEAPKAGPIGDSTETKPVTLSTTIWATLATIATSVGTIMSQVGDALKDWKTLAVLAVIGLGGYIIYERWRKSDIKGIV